MAADRVVDLCRLLGQSESIQLEFDWRQIEDEIEFPLAQDFKRLATIFSGVGIADFFWLLTPNGANLNLDFLTQRDRLADSLSILTESEPIPYPIDDLAPWAISDNGDAPYFLKNSNLTVVNGSRGPEWSEYDGSASQFLYDVLTGRFRTPIFPDDIVVD